jgi:uncharacterized protein YyaL (SSP411 family)
MSGQGGWPLNVFLTPDLKPFFGGTYFPPDNRQGRPGFLQLLQHIQKLWHERRQDIATSATDLHERLSSFTRQQADTGQLLSPAVLQNSIARFKDEYDAQHGGFGGAPKFPRPTQPLLMLRYAARFHDQEVTRMVLHTCERMAAGGIHDQLGGGFSRYSVDAQWLVPHFEKMLYDNAQLAQLYLDAWLVSGNSSQADVARGILRYVLRDMTHPKGGFYSAEDADSEGKEGKFYCWTYEEMEKLLTPEEFNVVTRHYGVTRQGNFVDHSDPDPLPGQNVLSVADPDLPESDRPLLDSARRKLFEARSQRVRPHLDDKILSSWNGMMLGAMARGYAVLGDEEFRTAAEKNLTFLRETLWDESTRTLHHRWRDGERDDVQLLDAYANLLAGVLDLYEATLDSRHLGFAVQLAESMIERFHDPEDGGFWQSAADPDELILRMKEDYDGAEPSGNSVAALALLRLAAVTGREDLKKAAEGTLRLFAARMNQLPQAVPALLCALDFWLDDPRRVVIAGDPDQKETRDLIHTAHKVYQPTRLILGTEGPVDVFTRTLKAKGKPTVYVCTGTACKPPVHTPDQLKPLLK